MRSFFIVKIIMYEEHKEQNDLIWQITELTQVAQQNQRSTEKTRDMVKCLLTEHEQWDAIRFRKDKGGTIYPNKEQT